jgi:hypothetical protein
LEDWFFEVVGEERILVWRLETANAGIEFFSFPECPVEEAEVGIGDFEGTWLVDCTVEGKLDSLDEMECDGVF